MGQNRIDFACFTHSQELWDFACFTHSQESWDFACFTYRQKLWDFAYFTHCQELWDFACFTHCQELWDFACFTHCQEFCLSNFRLPGSLSFTCFQSFPSIQWSVPWTVNSLLIRWITFCHDMTSAVDWALKVKNQSIIGDVTVHSLFTRIRLCDDYEQSVSNKDWHRKSSFHDERVIIKRCNERENGLTSHRPSDSRWYAYMIYLQRWDTKNPKGKESALQRDRLNSLRSSKLIKIPSVSKREEIWRSIVLGCYGQQKWGHATGQSEGLSSHCECHTEWQYRTEPLSPVQVRTENKFRINSECKDWNVDAGKLRHRLTIRYHLTVWSDRPDYSAMTSRTIDKATSVIGRYMSYTSVCFLGI